MASNWRKRNSSILSLAEENIEILAFLPVILLLLLTVIFSFIREYHYLFSGKTATASVIEIKGWYSRERQNSYPVVYLFFNENTGESQSYSTAFRYEDAAHYQRGQQIEVEYFGDLFYNSRIRGTGGPWLILLFIGLPCLVILSAIWYHRRFKRHRNKRKL